MCTCHNAEVKTIIKILWYANRKQTKSYIEVRYLVEKVISRCSVKRVLLKGFIKLARKTTAVAFFLDKVKDCRIL